MLYNITNFKNEFFDLQRSKVVPYAKQNREMLDPLRTLISENPVVIPEDKTLPRTEDALIRAAIMRLVEIEVFSKDIFPEIQPFIDTWNQIVETMKSAKHQRCKNIPSPNPVPPDNYISRISCSRANVLVYSGRGG